MKRNLHRKKIAENLDFAENGNVIRRNTEADFRVFQCKFTEKSTRGGALI